MYIISLISATDVTTLWLHSNGTDVYLTEADGETYIRKYVPPEAELQRGG